MQERHQDRDLRPRTLQNSIPYSGEAAKEIGASLFRQVLEVTQLEARATLLAAFFHQLKGYPATDSVEMSKMTPLVNS